MEGSPVKKWLLAILIAFAMVAPTVVVPTAVLAATQSYNPRFLDSGGNPVVGATVTIWNLSDPHDAGHILATSTTDGLGYVFPGFTLTIGNAYYFETNSSSLPNGQFTAPSPQTVIVLPINGGVFLDTSGTAQTKAGVLTLTAGVTLGTPLTVPNGGTGLSAFTANRCVRTPTTTTMASAAGDCITSVTAGTGITATGTATAPILGLTTPVAVSIGGTGATAVTANRCVRSASTTAYASAAGDCVTGVTAGSGNIVIGGTATAPTVDLAAGPTVTALTVSGLPSGRCVQTTTGGLLTTTGTACLGGISTITGATPITATTIAGATTVGCASCVTLTPATAQSGTINVSGAIGTAGGVALNATATNTITSSTSGSAPAFVMNAAGGTTGQLLELSLGGTPSVFFDNDGTLEVQAIKMFSTTGLQLSNSGSNAITSNSTGANDAFQFNANNVSAPTGSLAAFKVAGTNKVTISPAGVINSAALTASSSLCTDGSKNITTSGCSGGAVSSVSAGNANLVITPTTGAVVATLAATPSINSAILTPAAQPTASAVYISNDNAATNGMSLNVPISSTNAYRFLVGGSSKGTISSTGLATFGGGLSANTGTVIAASDGTTPAHLPPCYTAAGADCGTTAHIALTNCTITAAASTCSAGLAGAAIYTSATSFACSVTFDNAFAPTTLGYNTFHTTSSVVFVHTTAAVSANTVAYFLCVGN